jgi:excisionase family DNA binding protein
LTPREQLLGTFAPDVVEAFETLAEDVVDRRLAQPGRIFLTVPEYAARVGLSPQSIYRHVKLGHLEAVPVGGRILLKVTEIERLNTKQTPTGSVPNGRDLLQ